MSEMKCYTICIPNSCLHIYYFPFNQAYMISDVCCCKTAGRKLEINVNTNSELQTGKTDTLRNRLIMNTSKA